MYKKINNNIYIEKVNINKITKKYKKPIHIYSKKKILKNMNLYKNLNVFYAIKANCNIELLKIIGKKFNFETVSMGEMKLVKKIKKLKNVILSGVGKNKKEITYAIKKNIYSINVESVQELIRISNISNKLKKKVKLILRINLKIDCKTNKLVSTGDKKSKFGLFLEELKLVKKILKKNKFLKIKGIGFHLGSQIKNIKYYRICIKKILIIRKKLFNKTKIINIGGGININHNKKKQNNRKKNLKKIKNIIKKNKNIKFILEPGRSIISDACITIFKVEYIKRNFIITDLGMNNIIRPVLYKSFHKIINTKVRNFSKKKYNIVGPICECSDFLKKNVNIKAKQGDYLIMLNTGAYCYSMSSNYNLKEKAKEIIIYKNKIKDI
ncbi:diaminopimelate decarboxylase [Candidatus Vidania fulgoroideorum]